MAKRALPRGAVLDAKYYLGVLCQTREPDAGEHGFSWFIQGPILREWTGLADNALPVFPDPIPVRR